MESKNYITPVGLEKLKEEFSNLQHLERPKIVELVAWAASNGDRSENADYQYGKKRLREIDRRLGFLLGRIEAAEVVDPEKIESDQVVFGATVTVKYENEVRETYQIVGEDEWDVQLNRVSWRSPLAKALLSKKAGDEVVLIKPKGEAVLTIEKIEFKNCTLKK